MTASSVHSEQYRPEFAADGDGETRWASSPGAPEAWLQLDLGRDALIGGMRIHWERACAREYEVRVSTDGASWQTVHHGTTGAEGVAEIEGIAARARYVRIVCIKAAGYGLYSIWEVTLTGEESAQAWHEQKEVLETARREEARRRAASLRDSLAEARVDRIVYATRAMHPDGHWYANISYYAEGVERKTYRNGGGLYVLDLATGERRPLVEDSDGTIRDPAVDYDGQRILFSWRKGGTEHFHLYTINTDGSGLTQLTAGGYDDIEGAWLPDGGIVFVSSRARRWVQCWLTQVATLHRCDADGSNVQPISANIEHDNTPWPLPDGRVMYMRWEYVDRSQVDYHHLWTMNPDGTGQMAFFGNMHPSGVYIDAKPIPGTDEVILINSPGHGAREHAGHVAILSPKKGPDERGSLRNLTENGFRDPYALTPEMFLAAHGRTIVLLGRDGDLVVLHELDDEDGELQLHEPRPVASRTRERVIPLKTKREETTGRVILADAYTGRRMDGVERGDIASLLVLEATPKPINYTGGMDPISYGGTFTLERILGTVPVESDGSAYMELPANRALFFVALDAEGNGVKRMQSFLSVMPGETLSCVGCHEPRTQSVSNPRNPQLQALQRPASVIRPLENIPDVFDFPRDIQPILDTHCLPCHDYVEHPGAEHGPRAGGVVLSGDRGPMFSHSYVTLTVLKQFVDGRDQAVSNLAPHSIGAAASPLMQKVTGGHHGTVLSGHEIDMLRYWIESGAPYPGTYGALGGGAIGGYHENQQVEVDADWPESQAAAQAIAERCDGCHTDAMRLPRNLSDENDLSFWRPDWDDPRLVRSRHFMFNLTRPELSMMLLAPLGKDAGGYGLCTGSNGNGNSTAAFADTTDPDYQKILAMCAAGKTRLETIKRFDMPGFLPPAPYIREMKRYGVLPSGLPNDAPVDPYACDRAYWDSFSQTVALDHPAYTESQAPQQGLPTGNRGT